ncbi:glycosyltransferase family 2 protein [Polynucleobacter paneuropaeus]|jgi:hypothetical protein|nr:glycosyltransferase family 2 protein [Polynucleobacter paneuropaeus]
MQESQPYFSILVPCFKRPEYAREALYSILAQTYSNYEVVISNNGADGEVRKSVIDLAGDKRVRYVESAAVLSMPDHWEYLRSLVGGKYVLVLTDRSVLKPDALKIIQRMHDAMPGVSEVISWPWDLYYNDEKILMRYKGDGQAAIINSQEYLLCAASYSDSAYPYALPRGLNSCISNEILNTISDYCGSAFGRLNPDFSVGYRCLHTVKNFVHLDASLMVSQGLKLSNGGNSAKGEGGDYIESVGLTMESAFDKVPVKLPFVAAGMPQDLLASFDIYENRDGQREFNLVGFYVSCINELDLKKATRTLSAQTLNAFELHLRSALEKESLDLQQRVKDVCDFQKTLRFRYMFIVKRIVNKYLPNIARGHIMQMRGGIRLESALLA